MSAITLSRKGTPYQGQVNARRLVQRIYDFKDPNTGATRVGSQVRITPKGLQELHRRLGGVASLVLVEQQALAIGGLVLTATGRLVAEVLGGAS